MKSVLKINCEDITKIEAARASLGYLPADLESISAQIHRSIVKDCDYRKSLAFGTLKQQDAPLSFVRSLIQRGNLKQAQEHLALLEHEAHDDPTALAFLIFERTRIAFFESDWHQTVSRGAEALRLNPPPVTQLALNQLIANAHFELGDFDSCKMCLEQVEILGSLFPHALSLFYAQMLWVRLTARTLGPETATAKLDQLFRQQIDAQRQDNDLIFSYCRAKMDILRVRRQSALAESLACFILSEAAGDKLYSALAILDISCEFGLSPPEFVLAGIARLKNEFLRFQKLAGEMDGLGEQTTTGKTLKRHREVSFTNSSSPFIKNQILKGAIETNLKTALIFLKPQKLLIVTEPFKVFSFQKEKQIPMALEAMMGGPIPKEVFFRAVWGAQKYAPHLHDTHISSLLHRAKKDYSIPFQVSGGLVKCNHVLLEIR